MAIKKANGLILKEVTVKDSDKIITVYTKEEGKISLYVKGAKKQKNKMLAGTTLFAFSEFVYKEGKNLGKLYECNVYENHKNILRDLNKSTYASYISEFLNAHTLEGEINEDILKLTMVALRNINIKKMDLKLIKLVYELKFLVLLGIYPNFFKCSSCQDKKAMFFDYKEGGVICSKCKENDPHIFKLSEDTIKAYKYIVLSDIKSVFNFKVNDRVLNEMKRLNSSFLKFHMDKKIKSESFIEKIELLRG